MLKLLGTNITLEITPRFLRVCDFQYPREDEPRLKNPTEYTATERVAVTMYHDLKLRLSEESTSAHRMLLDLQEKSLEEGTPAISRYFRRIGQDFSDALRLAEAGHGWIDMSICVLVVVNVEEQYIQFSTDFPKVEQISIKGYGRQEFYYSGAADKELAQSIISRAINQAEAMARSDLSREYTSTFESREE